MKRYAALFVPEFRLQATLRYGPGWATEPVALLVAEGTKTFIAERNTVAHRKQVERGMTPTQALARCPGLNLITPNSGHERSAQDALLQTAECLSPFLESTASGVVTVELPEERTLPESEFMEKIVTSLQVLGLDAQVGVAENPDLALLAARLACPVRIVEEAEAFLAPLSVRILVPSAETGLVLESWGIRTIGQLTALPRAQVCERLDPDAMQLWEQATGGRARPLNLVKPREFFTEETDLEHPVEMLEPLLFLLRRFLEQISARLAHANLVANKLRLVLRFEKGESYQRVLTIPHPTREVNLLFRMLHTHLEGFTSEFPIIGLELAARPVRPQSEQFDLLEKGLRDPHQFTETLARLQALLGPDRVGTPRLESSHHPDAFRVQPYDSTAPVAQEEEPLGIPWQRFRPPLRARLIFNQDRPAFLYSSCATGAIREARGPWLLEGEWWAPQRWSREEWDIVTDDGVYRLVRSEDEWFVEGIYA